MSEAPVVFIVLADLDGWKGGHAFVENNFKEWRKTFEEIVVKFD